MMRARTGGCCNGAVEVRRTSGRTHAKAIAAAAIVAADTIAAAADTIAAAATIAATHSHTHLPLTAPPSPSLLLSGGSMGLRFSTNPPMAKRQDLSESENESEYR